jgi:hypothetical protein
MNISDKSFQKIGNCVGIDCKTALTNLSEADVSAISEDLLEKKENILRLLDGMLFTGMELEGQGSAYQDLEDMVEQVKELLENQLANVLNQVTF